MREPKEYQEALGELEGLEIYDDDCDGNVCYESHSKIEDLCSFELLQELVDKTKPMKPIKRYYTSSYGNNGIKKRVDIKCACCGSSFINGVRSSIGVFQDKEKEFIKTIDNQKCCRFCGQFQDWSDE